jgi:membrane protein
MKVKDLVLGLLLLRWLRRRPAATAGEAAPAPAPTDVRAVDRVPDRRRGRPARGLKGAWLLVRDAAKEWSNDKAPRLGAALAYYTVFAIAPVLLVAMSVAGLALGQQAAQGHIIDELRSMFGDDTARMIQEALAKSSERKSGVIGTVVGVGTLLVGATAVMIELEAALDAVWKVVPRPGRGLKGLVRERLLSLGLVLSLGFLLLVSLVTSAGLAAMGDLLENWSFPGADIAGHVLNNLLSVGLIAAFFALIFKYLPNTKIAWRDVWFGALITSALFHVGKIGIGFYLGRATVASTFGAAGSLAVLLVWVYYSAQIVLFGAEMTRLFAERYGSGVRPDENAVPAAQAGKLITNTT